LDQFTSFSGRLYGSAHAGQREGAELAEPARDAWLFGLQPETAFPMTYILPFAAAAGNGKRAGRVVPGGRITHQPS
jgi:hypothetical protein